MLRLALAAVLLASSAVADAGDWRSARWGMDAAALDRAVPGLRVLDPPWTYGAELSAPRALTEARIAGMNFRALFQTDAEGRLAQILFERRRRDLRPDDAARALAALREARGPEARLCLAPPRHGGPAAAEAVWPAPEGVLHLTWMDFGTGETLSDLDEAERLSLLREGRDRAARDLRREMSPPGALVGALPRRLALRWRDPGRPELASRLCPPLPVPRP